MKRKFSPDGASMTVTTEKGGEVEVLTYKKDLEGVFRWVSTHLYEVTQAGAHYLKDVLLAD